MLAHLRTDVGPWAGDATLAALDAALADAGSTPLDLPWERFALARDGDHFTPAGSDAFAAALAAAVRARWPRAPVHVVSDSTLRGRRAQRALRRHLGDAALDVVCGSGFVARAAHGEHFRARVSRALRGGARRGTLVLLVGGWNDARDARWAQAPAAARACAALARRWTA